MRQNIEKFKVIHIVRQFSPAVGGLENFVFSLAKEQIKNGLAVEVITLNKVFHQKGNSNLDVIEIIDGIKVTRIPYLGSYKYPLAFGALSKIKTADIVHVHAIDFFADYLSITRWIHKKKLVISTHGGFFHTSYASKLKKLFFNVVTRFSLKGYKAVVACSESDYFQFEEIKKNNLYLIENGVDTNKFELAEKKSPSKCLAFIGRFSQNKRIDLLLTFFSKLVELDRHYRLLIIGKDWENSLHHIYTQINELGISNNVNVLTDLSDNEIKTYLNDTSFIVSASDYEGFGLSIIEGMSAGLIPICSKIPSFTKIIDSAEVGLNIDFNKLENALLVNDFINNQLEDYTNKTYQTIQAANKYSWSIKALEFDGIYERISGNANRIIQGVTIDIRSSNDVIEHLDTRINNNQKTLLAFANAHTINVANQDLDFKKFLESFLVLNDGIGLQIASKLKYNKGFIDNLNGTDFIPKFLSETTQTMGVFLLGATEDTVKKSFNVWTNQYSKHKWCGYHNGFFDKENCEEVLEEINESGADLLIVAMGNPLQEKWIYQNKDKLNIKLAVGVGALFDFTAGNVVRAPVLVQKLKVEWIYRLIQEPKRLWRRYIIGNVVFLWNAIND